MARSAFRNPFEPLAQGFGGSLNAGLGMGMQQAMAQRQAQQQEDALMRKLTMQAQLEQQGKMDLASRNSVLDNIAQLDVPADTRNAAIDLTSWPAATQQALREDVGNQDVNAVNDRTRNALIALDSAPRMKKPTRSPGVQQSAYDLGQRVIRGRGGEQGIAATLSAIENLDPLSRKRGYDEFLTQLRAAGQLEDVEITPEIANKVLRATFNAHKIDEADAAYEQSLRQPKPKRR